MQSVIIEILWELGVKAGLIVLLAALAIRLLGARCPESGIGNLAGRVAGNRIAVATAVDSARMASWWFVPGAAGSAGAN